MPIHLWERDTRFWSAVRALPRALTPGTISTGIVTCTMVLTVPTLLIFQAANGAGFSSAQTSSWFFATYATGGLMTIALSLLYRQPIGGGVSVIVVAFLVQALPGFTMAEAVGAYLAHGTLILLLTLTGAYNRLMAALPHEIVMGMLAGAFFRFGTGIFRELVAEPLLVTPILLAWLAAVYWPRKALPPVVAALGVGIVVSLLLHPPASGAVGIEFTLPEFYRPAFNLDALLSIAVPMTLIVLTTQNTMGISVMQAIGYRPPVAAITTATGAFTILTAFMGGQGACLGTQRSAIAGDPSVHPDASLRYGALVVDGLLLMLAALFATTLLGVFRLIPLPAIRTVAGLAILPVLLTSLQQSVGVEKRRWGALVALLIAASNVEFLGIGSVFWALILAPPVSWLVDSRQSPPQP